MRTEQGAAVTGQMPGVPIFTADLVPRCHSLVWDGCDKAPSCHPHVCPGCPRDVSGCGMEHTEPVQLYVWMYPSSFTPASEKNAGLRALRFFPLAKQNVLQVKSEISEILIFQPGVCTALLREGEDSLVFILPDKTRCLLGWQIERIEGFDPETGEIKEEKKLHDPVVFCQC